MLRSDHYVWLAWSSAFLVPWLGLLIAFPRQRRVMIWASALTMLFGLTEPLFVPRYWDPPSLFDLAQRTGFDIESLIFSFAIGGVGAVLYNIVTRQELRPVGLRERRKHRHRYHRLRACHPSACISAAFPSWLEPNLSRNPCHGIGWPGDRGLPPRP
jgi:hypothetical protein